MAAAWPRYSMPTDAVHSIWRRQSTFNTTSMQPPAVCESGIPRYTLATLEVAGKKYIFSELPKI
jgi:hypothetical protein